MPSLGTAVLIAFSAGAVFWLAQRYFRLAAIPGPFLCRFTNLPRVGWVKSGNSHEIHRVTHDKYGDVVRFGPNMVSVSDPAAISTIYPSRSGFPKGDFYHVFRDPEEPPDVFTMQDEALHKALRSPVSALYTSSKLQFFESVVDQNIERFFSQLDRVVAGSSEATCCLTTWLQAFAFDAVWSWMFTTPYGLVERGTDEAKKVLSGNWEIFKMIGPMSQSASLRGLGGILYLVSKLFNHDATLPIHRETMDLIKQREQDSKPPAEKAESDASSQDDMMSQLVVLKANQPTIPAWTVPSLSLLNVFAGSDSTSVVMGTIWYNLLLHRQTMQRLYNELLDAGTQGTLTRPIPAWKEVQNLPYLDACVNEALRLHPPFCLPFERVVPMPGVTISGHYLPPGTLIGMSPYVVGRHRPTFGEDADEWRPERWVDCTLQERRKLDQTMLSFGAGRRVCLGKNVAIMEIKKLVSAVLLQYEMELIDPARFKVENSWFFKQEGLEVKIRSRSR